MTTKKTVKFGLATLLAVAVQMAASGVEFTYDHILTETDTKNNANSLTTGHADQNWSDGYTIQEGDEDVVLYVPAGMSARTISSTQTVVPIIYAAGCIYPRGSSGLPTTFNDLRLLDGGYIDGQQVGAKCGNITILSEDPENPAQFLYHRSDTYGGKNFYFPMQARVSGSKDSQLLYTRYSTSGYGYLRLQVDSDWSGFHGTLRIDDGLGVLNYASAPIDMPGTVRFGNGGILWLTNASGPYSFGNLSFADGGAITNTGSGATLTVSGTFDTGTNCKWRSRNTGTFGTLILGDGLALSDDQNVPTTVFTVTNRLEVGNGVSVTYSSATVTEGLVPTKVLLMKLSPEAVTAGVPDLSRVAVSFSKLTLGEASFLTTEPDPDAEGGLLVYATHDPAVYHIGPDEWKNSACAGYWLMPEKAADEWADGLYPGGETRAMANLDTSTEMPNRSAARSTFSGTSTASVRRQVSCNSETRDRGRGSPPPNEKLKL